MAGWEKLANLYPEKVITSLPMGSETLIALHRMGQDVDEGPPWKGKTFWLGFSFLPGVS